jgi:glycolate oxidase FAD binding subunit
MHVGNRPERYDVALDMTGLSQGIEHVAGDLTVITDAGVTVAALQETLAKAGQRLPFDVPDPGKATIGGSVASNAAGHMRSSLGGIRDWVIGMKIVLADGTVTKTGGRVVKNVQGYDLHRLHTGAFGTLGVIAEIGFKLTPLPIQSRTVAVRLDSLEGAGGLVMGAFNGPLAPEAMTVFAGATAAQAISTITGSGGASVLVLARVTGGDSAVTRQVHDLTGAAGVSNAAGYDVLQGDAADTLWSAAAISNAGPPITVRATFKPTDAFAFAADAMKIDGGCVEIQGGFGTVIAGIASGEISGARALRDAAASHRGSAVIEQCPAEVKREMDIYPDAGASLAVMRSVKQRFDPQRILNPGRFIGRI